MTKWQRIKSVFLGLISLVFSIVLILDHNIGFPLIMIVFGVSMVIYGVYSLVYYFMLARHMVGGKYPLYIGIIMLDFGMFSLTIFDKSRMYVILYLIVCNVFSGVVDILRAHEARSYQGAWKLKLARGIVSVLTAIACCVFIKSDSILVYIYAAGLISSSCTRIITAFRRSAIVYIS